MFSLTTATKSEEMFHKFIEIQSLILTGLELSFRILNMPSEELGAPAYIKYDMEAWMPGRNSYGEVIIL
jgi:seryl-tRNA synthetase